MNDQALKLTPERAKEAGLVPVDRLPVAAPASESAAILSVIERMALNPDIDPERVERFIALKRQMDADNAKRDFEAAVSSAKAELTPIVKNRDGHNSKYADLAAIAEVVDPVLSKYGLNYRHRAAQTDRISITCILSHTSGHSEETTLSGPPDASGAKNAIQAIGSSGTYLQRYTLVLALGLSTAMPKDDDGKAAGIGETITDEQRNQLQTLIDAKGVGIARFCDFLHVDALADLPATRFLDAKRALEAKRAAK